MALQGLVYEDARLANQKRHLTRLRQTRILAYFLVVIICTVQVQGGVDSSSSDWC